MQTAVALFTRDLRLADNPMLRAALDAAECVVPLFVRDEGIRRTAFGAAERRRAFLDGALADLDASLTRIGGRLEVRCGEVVAETVRVARETGAQAVFATADVTPYARRRERALRAALDLRLVDGHFVVPPGAVAPEGRESYAVFTPYHRAWQAAEPGAPLEAPRRLRMPPGLDPPPIRGTARSGPPGGETPGRDRLRRWLRSGASRYEARKDVPAADGTSRLSPYLHFGCLSARELAARAERVGASFVRQLCWRDFYAQLLWANPSLPTHDLRSRGDDWVDDPDALEAWKAGMTGYPLVDAGMRQLAQEGWMHNRARLVAASFLVKHLGVDWREGADHFFDLLVDGDVAQNVGNWQWVAGTGPDARPNRVFSPLRQARRLDPDGDYVRRYVPELADLPDPHEPGLLAPAYPAPIVEHEEAVAAFRGRRAASARSRV